jgi:ActR/RegA family two-component response regulator
MKPTALLVTRDRAALLLLRAALDVLEIDTQVCYSTEEAIAALVEQDYAAVVLDFDLPQAAQVARMSRIAHPARKPLVGAMVGFYTAVNGAAECGINFVLHKPLNVEEVTRCLNASKKTMQANRRRSPRGKMETLVHLEFEGRVVPALSHDVSEHGLALQAPEPLPYMQDVDLCFVLPGTNHKVEAHCEVIWADKDGCAGLFFTQLTPQSRKHLKIWMAQRRPRREDAVRVLLPPMQRWYSKVAGR